MKTSLTEHDNAGIRESPRRETRIVSIEIKPNSKIQIFYIFKLLELVENDLS